MCIYYMCTGVLHWKRAGRSRCTAPPLLKPREKERKGEESEDAGRAAVYRRADRNTMYGYAHASRGGQETLRFIRYGYRGVLYDCECNKRVSE
jgi:hypothetical protein